MSSQHPKYYRLHGRIVKLNSPTTGWQIHVNAPGAPVAFGIMPIKATPTPGELAATPPTAAELATMQPATEQDFNQFIRTLQTAAVWLNQQLPQK